MFDDVGKFALIDAYLIKYGVLRKEHIHKLTHYKSASITRLLARYRESFPENMLYDTLRKEYVVLRMSYVTDSPLFVRTGESNGRKAATQYLKAYALVSGGELTSGLKLSRLKYFVIEASFATSKRP